MEKDKSENKDKSSWRLDVKDIELLILSKHLNRTELAKMFNVTPQAIGAKLKRIRRDQKLKEMELLGDIKKDTIVITPKTFEVNNLIELATTLLMQQKDKNPSTREIIQISKALASVARIKTEIMTPLLEQEAMVLIVNILKDTLAECDETLKTKFAQKIQGNKTLCWLLGDEEPEVLETKKEVSKEKRPPKETPVFDEDLW